MSVKNKVKRCNKEIIRLEEELKTYKLSNERLRQKLYCDIDEELLKNIIKYAVTNHIGGLDGGMCVSAYEVDKMKDLKLDVSRGIFGEYTIRVFLR